jgi:tetratricopeptide (TPR) repeat protein
MKFWTKYKKWNLPGKLTFWGLVAALVLGLPSLLLSLRNGGGHVNQPTATIETVHGTVVINQIQALEKSNMNFINTDFDEPSGKGPSSILEFRSELGRQTITSQDMARVLKSASDAAKLLEKLASGRDKQDAQQALRVDWEMANLAYESGATQTSFAAVKRILAQTPTDAAAVNLLGHIYCRLGDLTGAEEAYTRVLALGKTDATPLIEATGLFDLAQLARTRGRHDDACRMLKEALPLYLRIGHNEGAANTNNELGKLAAAQGHSDEAVSLFMTSMATYEKLGSPYGKAVNFTDLAQVYKSQGNIDQAEDYLLQALAMFEESGSVVGVAVTNSELGQVFMARRKYSEAEARFRKALSSLKDAEDVQRVSILTNQLGKLAEQRGNLDEAIVLFRQSLDSCNEKDFPCVMACNHSDLGRAYAQKSQLGLAKEHHRKALAIYEKIDSTYGIAVQRYQLARLALAENQPERAEQLFTSSIEQFAALKAWREVAANYFVRGSFFSKRGNQGLAQTMYEKALLNAERSGHRLSMGLANACLGLTLFNRQELDCAATYFFRAHQLLEEAGEKELAKELLGLSQSISSMQRED